MITNVERDILYDLPNEMDGGAYYCDLDISYPALEKLERKGLVASKDRSHWWKTAAADVMQP